MNTTDVPRPWREVVRAMPACTCSPSILVCLVTIYRTPVILQKDIDAK